MGRRLAEVRRIALALPGVTERVSHGEPCFFVRDKRPLCYFHDDHRGDGRVSLWCPAPPGIPEELTASERWSLVSTENFRDHAAFNEFQASFRRLFGFDVEGVTYDEPVEPDVPWPT